MGTESYPRPCVKRERSKVEEWICFMNMESRILLKGGACRFLDHKNVSQEVSAFDSCDDFKG